LVSCAETLHAVPVTRLPATVDWLPAKDLGQPVDRQYSGFSMRARTILRKTIEGFRLRVTENGGDRRGSREQARSSRER
jgi:hypothetical protein